ncbi:MAG: addiction module toxin RelE [archaeon]|jgi:mRNA-degrading endonuclease RelE of RelBE toxin-antitoxin system|nr:addiction module toxin RelE [archaeon]MCK9439467.1 addiction module toxin RelE [Patescibacteria group bacterium]MDD2478099.1 addiction module toxin RelE [Candidatus ainarchaeum sp.]MDD3085018.1 addiction module toxin RelE [Candidatus ainarchaeum sp.]
MDFEFHKELLKNLIKLSKKDPMLYSQILTKIDEIKNNIEIEHYKNLKNPLQNFKRVHITQKFVLIFRYLKKENKILFRYFEHRDYVYKRNYD